MKWKFYDVKKRTSVETEVTGKKAYEGKSGTRYSLKGMTDDGRNLTSFVSKDVFDSAQV